MFLPLTLERLDEGLGHTYRDTASWSRGGAVKDNVRLHIKIKLVITVVFSLSKLDTT